MNDTKPSSLRINELPKRIIDLMAEFEEDCKLMPVNLTEKTFQTPGLKAKWLGCWSAEKSYLTRMETAREKLIEDYTKNHGEIGKPKYVTDREAIMSAEILKLDNGMKVQKEIIRYLDGIMDIMSKFNFDVKNCVDMTKMEAS